MQGVAHVDVRIAELASRQHGVVSRRQLMALGASPELIRQRLSRRLLVRVHAGVYTVGHPLLSLRGRYLAAVLACGDNAVLSHLAAGALLDLRPLPSGPIDVTIPRGGSRRRAGLAVHTTRSLDPEEVTAHDGIPCTTPARTLVDMAAIVTARVLDRALERSLVLNLFDLTGVEAAIGRANGRRGVGTLRRMVARMSDAPPFLRSELERRFLALVRKGRLQMPVVNGLIAGHEVDFHWPKQRLIVETDGRSTHDTTHAFERDRRRDLQLELAGWHVIRIGWRQVVDRPDQVRALLRTRLSSR
jgi:very-short-patch-repair endonuclease